MHTKSGNPLQDAQGISVPAQGRRLPLWQEIALALLLKLALLIGIKLMFFSHPVSKHDAAARLNTVIAGEGAMPASPSHSATQHKPESK